jgi:hypothetical protein
MTKRRPPNSPLFGPIFSLLKDADPKIAECFAAFLAIRDRSVRDAITGVIVSIAGSAGNESVP